MKVTGYWPLDGSVGVAFLRRLVKASPARLEQALRDALSAYVVLTDGIREGRLREPIEPELFRDMVDEFGSELQVKLILRAWEEDGRYWMLPHTGDEAARAFIAAAVVARACGATIAGEIHRGEGVAIGTCADKLVPAQVTALREPARAAVSALVYRDELAFAMRAEDKALMGAELRTFHERLADPTPGVP